MTDTDILVREEDGMKSWLLLQKNGFTPYNIKSPLHNKILPQIGKHLPTLLKDGIPLRSTSVSLMNLKKMQSWKRLLTVR